MVQIQSETPRNNMDQPNNKIKGLKQGNKHKTEQTLETLTTHSPQETQPS